MSNIIQVSMGEMAVSHESVIFSTGGVGSCLIICMYDRAKKIGGLAHAMLPRRKDSTLAPSNLETSAKYVDEAIESLYTKLTQMGAAKDNLSVKLVGGASMFSVFKNKEGKGIGEQNISAAYDELQKRRISIVGEDVGGTSGKMVDFNLSNGILNVNLKI